jgi:hypothetical protein
MAFRSDDGAASDGEYELAAHSRRHDSSGDIAAARDEDRALLAAISSLEDDVAIDSAGRFFAVHAPSAATRLSERSESPQRRRTDTAQPHRQWSDSPGHASLEMRDQRFDAAPLRRPIRRAEDVEAQRRGERRSATPEQETELSQVFKVTPHRMPRRHPTAHIHSLLL